MAGQQQNSMEGDPHVLAVLNSVEIGQNVLAGDIDRRYSLQGGPFHTSHGIVDNHEAHIRSFPVLDALASLSVSEKNKQVVAIALQMNNDTKEIRLTIAENRDVDPKVVEHIQRLWKLLRTLSDQHALLRFDPNHPTHDWTIVASPPVPDTLLDDPVCREIIRCVYEFSAEKNKARFNKWWPGLAEFATRFEQQQKDLPGTPDQKDRFINIVYSLDPEEAVKHAPDGSIIPDENWHEFVLMMDGAAEDVDVLLEDDSICEMWARSLAVNGKQPFRLRGALEKMTTQHRQINILLSFALSPRLRRAFEYDMSIHPLARPHPVEISYPSSADGWRLVINDVCQKNSATPQWLEKEANRLAKRFPAGHERGSEGSGSVAETSASYLGMVHCECALIAFLETDTANRWSAIPPFSYIGVSKLSCRACHCWIKAFNALGGRKYYTRGSHSKWYFSWAMPEFSSVALREAVAGIFGREYAEFKVATGEWHTDSDSSDASDKGAKVKVGAANAAERQQRLKQRKARGLGFIRMEAVSN